jgi:hypothetical protein
MKNVRDGFLVSATALFLPFLFILTPQEMSAQISRNVLERILKVRVNAHTMHEEIATAFTLEVDGREYLITAKHIVQGLKDEDHIDVLMNDNWSPLEVKIYRCDDPIDIAVLVPPRQLTGNLNLPFDSHSYFYGQDAYFLGFPYGIQSSGHGINGPYPLPVIKRGTISGKVDLDRSKKASLLLLDGYNNPGFSGGPIVFRDLNQPSFVMSAVGVISGFQPEVVPVMKQQNIKSPTDASDSAKTQPWMIQRRTDGSYFEYIATGNFLSLNTGIVRGFFIDPAVDMIRKHPIGPVTKDLPDNQPSN